jgi:AcrR family transcriptional regulator
MSAQPAPRRDPDATRLAILGAAFEEIQAVGFRAASLEHILARAGVTKGALYHHFPNKQALGLAVIDELIWPEASGSFAILADESVNPVEALIGFVREEIAEAAADGHLHGCPVCNLVQDMAAIDEEFRLRLLRIQNGWREAIANALRRGQRQGTVRKGIDAERMAAVLVAAYEGANVLAKAAQDDKTYVTCMQGLIDLGETLRPR